MAFRDPILTEEQLNTTGIHSENYEEATSGWRIGADGMAQFESLDVLNTLSAETLYAGDTNLSQLKVNGRDVNAFITKYDAGAMSPYGMGVVGRMPPTTVNLTAYGSNTANNMFGAYYVEYPGRMYHANFRAAFLIDPAASWYVKVKKAVVGFNLWPPSNTSGTVLYTQRATQDQDINRIELNLDVYFPATSTIVDSEPSQAMVYVDLYRTVGTGNLTVDVAYPVECVIEDIGPIPGSAYDTVNGIADSGYAFTTVPPPVPPPNIIRKTVEFPATWSRTYNFDTRETTWDDSQYCYQGKYSSARGNNVSLIGFDRNAIYNAINGYQTIHSVKLRFRVAHSYYGSGAVWVLGRHNYSAKPINVNVPFQGALDQLRTSSLSAGGPYTVNLNAGFITQFLGSGYGLTVGALDTNNLNYYGYLHGATMGDKPTLIVDYSK